MTYAEQVEMLEDYLQYADEPVDTVPSWYKEWWIKNHAEGK